ncbi:MAG: glutathione S-transferase family protein [Myxococcota bacterium]
MIVLYGAARVPFTEKVRRALLYKGVSFELREPRSKEDYTRWNPKTGLLPFLDLDGEGIEDSTEILLRLDERFPEPPLLSRDPMVADQQRQLEEWADESFLWYFLKYRRMIGEELGLPLAEGSDGGTYDTPSPTSGSLRRLGAWLRAGGTWERPLTALLRELGLRMDDLVNFLGARPFFYSETLSMADLGVYAMLFTMRKDAIPGASRLIQERPNLAAFMGRVEDATRDREAA